MRKSNPKIIFIHPALPLLIVTAGFLIFETCIIAHHYGALAALIAGATTVIMVSYGVISIKLYWQNHRKEKNENKRAR